MTSLNTLQDFTERGSFDELYTPVEAIRPLLKHLPKFKAIWEPTDPGNSKITLELLHNGYEVCASHIQQGQSGDFLSPGLPPIYAEAIVTNPPYSQKDNFLKRAYEYGLPFAFLLPTVSISGMRRNKMFREHGIELIVLDKRIDFTGKGAVWFPTAWFCWKILPTPNTIVFETVGEE